MKKNWLGKYRNFRDSDARKPLQVTPSKVSLVNTASDDDSMPELTCSNSTPSSELHNFQSIDDFSTENSHSQSELPNLSELINDPLITQPGENEALSLDEETVFLFTFTIPSIHWCKN